MAREWTLLEKCGTRLPVDTTTDTYLYDAFLPLDVEAKGSGAPVPAVYPLDRAKPWAAQQLRRLGVADAQTLRGGESPVSAWQPLDPSSDPLEIRDAHVKDVSSLLRNGQVQVGGKTLDIEVTPDLVETLAIAGQAVVPGVGDRQAVRLVLSPEDQTALGQTIAVGGAPAGMATPVAQALGGGGAHLYALRIGSSPASSSGPLTSVESILSRVERGVVPADLTLDPTRAAASPLNRLVVHLPLRQEWTLLGYARGELLNSIALTPLEELTVEVSTWDRRKRDSQQTSSVSQDSSTDIGSSTKATFDVVNEVANSGTFQHSLQADVQLPLRAGLTVGAGGQMSDVQKTSNDVKSSTQTVAEATSHASEKIRSSRQTKITESREWGSETKTTRKLRNANTGRVVTYDFFEVVCAHTVRTYPDLAGAGLAVLVDLPSPLRLPWSRELIVDFEGPLRAALLDATQVDGFAAARTLAARDRYCRFHCSAACDCEGAAAPSPAAVSDLQTQLKDAAQAIDDAFALVAKALPRVNTLKYRGASDQQIAAAETDFRRWLYKQGCVHVFGSGFWDALVRFSQSPRAPEDLDRLFDDLDSKWLDAAAMNDAARVLGVGAMLSGVLGAALALFAGSWLFGEIDEAEPVPHFYMAAYWPLAYAPLVLQGADDAGLGAAVKQAKGVVDVWRKAQAAQAAATAQPAPPTAAPPPSGIHADYPDAEMALHQVNLDALIAHLRANDGYYRFALWNGLDPLARQGFLSTTGLLGAHLEPRALGIVRNQLVVPYRVDDEEELLQLLAALAELDAAALTDEREIVLPTSGVVVETRVSDCEATEPYVQEIRATAVRKAKAEAEQAEHEAARYALRLSQQPPLLDSPLPARDALSVHLDGGTSAAAPDTKAPGP